MWSTWWSCRSPRGDGSPMALGLTIWSSVGVGPVAGVQGAPRPLEPAPVDDLVVVPQRRRVVVRVEAVDLSLEPVGIEVADATASVRADGCRRSTRRRRPAGTRPRSARRRRNRPTEVVEPSPPHIAELVPVAVASSWRPRRRGAWRRRRRGWPGGRGPDRRQHQGRVEADRLLVEGPVAVEIPGHHRNVADAARLAHRRSLPVAHAQKAFTGQERICSVGPTGVRRSAPR